MKTKLCAGALALLLALGLCACKTQPQPGEDPAPQPAELQRESGVNPYYFDTVVTITTYGTGPEVIEGAFELIGEYHAMFARTQEGSDVWRINHANGQPTQVSEQTRELIELSIHYGELSGGLFDITIAPVVELWDFKADEPSLPDEAELQKRLELVDYTRLKLDGDRVTLPAGMAIDLGAIAKGYTCDRVVDYLREQGVEHATVNMGGNVYAIGHKPGGSEWTVGLQNPFAETGEYMAAYRAHDRSIVTSGNYERNFTLDGVLYHHIIDPRTGYPAQSGVSSVAIISASSADGDALSTTCFMLGSEQGLALIEGIEDTEAIYIDADGGVTMTPGAQEGYVRTE